MPELPEVETARRAVEEHCKGFKITKSIIADDPKVIEGVSPKDFQASLIGKTIVAAHRKGKNMWIQLDSPPFPTFQFGMAGAVYIKGVAVAKYKRSAIKDEDEWPSKYSKFFIELDNGLELSFTDKRRFARVRLLENPVSVPPISELGPDALLEPMTIEEFHQALRKKKTGIKAVLLDQSFMSGIGNWIADEVLYQARIHPMQIASSMSKETCAELLKCINEVIEKAVEVGADSDQFPSNWIYHYREKKDKAFVDGKKIDFITAGGRTTAYVPELQKLSGAQSAKTSKKLEKTPKGKGTNSAADEDEPGSEEEEAKAGGRGRKPKSTKRSTNRKKVSKNDSDEEDSESESDGDDDQKKTRGAKKPAGRNKDQKKKTTAKRKSGKSIDVDDDDDDEDDDGDDDVAASDVSDDENSDAAEKPSKRAQPKAAKTSKKKAASSQNRKRSKKAN